MEIWAEYLQQYLKPTDGIPRKSLTTDGWYVQAAAYVVPKLLQGVVKYDTFDPNLNRTGDETNTWTLGLNYYIKGHDLKLQLDYLNADVRGVGRQEKWLARFQTIF